MDDSNQQTQQPEAAAPATPKASSQQPKTFLQQFHDLETMVYKHAGFVQEADMAFSITASGLKQCIEEIALINDQLQAMLLLGESGTPVTRINVANKVQQLRVDEAKTRLNRDEQADIIRKIDAVVDSKSVVVYDDESKGLSYAYNPAGKFGKDLTPQFIGKKVGDTVGTVKILALYELVPEADRKPITPELSAEGLKNDQQVQ